MLIETDELLTLLYEKFPDSVPEQVNTMRDLGVKVGEQRTIKYIEHVLEAKQYEADQLAKKSKK